MKYFWRQICHFNCWEREGVTRLCSVETLRMNLLSVCKRNYASTSWSCDYNLCFNWLVLFVCVLYFLNQKMLEIKRGSVLTMTLTFIVHVWARKIVCVCRQLDCLRQLVVVLCERAQLHDLIQFPYINLHEEVQYTHTLLQFRAVR